MCNTSGIAGTQTQAHPSAIDVSPDNRFVIVPDLGLDKALIYHFDPRVRALSHRLIRPFAAVPAGKRPRHFVFDSGGRFGYLMNELDGVVSVFAWDAAQGTLTNVQDASTQVPDFVGSNHTAEIEISPDGRFLYQSNRRLRTDNVRGPTPSACLPSIHRRAPDFGGTDAYGRHHAAQLCHRPHGKLPAGSE